MSEQKMFEENDPEAMKYLQENWLKLPLKDLKNHLGWTEGQISWVAYGKLRLPRRDGTRGISLAKAALKQSYIMAVRPSRINENAKVKEQPYIRLPGAIILALGVSYGDAVETHVDNKTDAIVLKMTKKKPSMFSGVLPPQ